MIWAALLAFLLAATLHASAQEPGSSCEDKLRATRVYADAMLKNRNRQEAEAAQAIADLLKRVDGLQAQLEMLMKSRQPEK
jgi:hypothetical protein